MNKSRRKLLMAMLILVFVLLSAIAVVAIAFSLTQQTITSTLNVSYSVKDLYGTASAKYTIGGETKSLKAYKNGVEQGTVLKFEGETTTDAGGLQFPEALVLTNENDNVVIEYTYTNTGALHYIASMTLGSALTCENMLVEYSTDGTNYLTNRYAVVVPAGSTGTSYYIRISIDNKALNANLSGTFNWFLDDYDDSSPAYLSLTSLTFVEDSSSTGAYWVSVSSSGDYAGRLVIPSEINGNAVTYIEKDDMDQDIKDQITSIYIPASVTGIQMSAFLGYANLQTVEFEEGSQLTRINSGVFANCTKLTSITIPSSVTGISNRAFTGCTSLTSVTIPSSVTTGLVGNPFAGCPSLTKLEVDSANTVFHSEGNCIIRTSDNQLVVGCKTSVIPTDGSVTKIGSQAFYGSGITSITIPENVTEMGTYAFAGCAGLTTIVVDPANTIYHSEGNCIIETADNQLVVGCKTSVIPTDGSVTKIGSQAFYRCTGLTSITIPSSVTSIGGYAFYNCAGLTSITIPSSVTSIGGYAFYNCAGLTSVTISENVTSIGSNAFQSCTGLTSITIPSSVTSIGNNVFKDCTGLGNIKFDNTSGWAIADSSSATSWTNIDVTDTEANVTSFTDVYVTKYWKRS